MRLKGKKVLVTGASKGIGRAIALNLAGEGAKVGLHYHQDADHASEVLAEVLTKEAGGVLFEADFNNPSEALKLGEDAWDQLGGIDYLVNNAGVSYKVHSLDAGISDIDFFFNVNLKSTFLLTQAITRKMVEHNRSGSIFTITSINGIQPGIGLSIYGASKGALETLMKGMALELGPHNIRVNTIAAGAFRTDMTAANWQNEDRLRRINENIPLGRMGEPEEAADLIVNLLIAGTYMTGATIVLDGGWMMNQGWVNPSLYNKDK